MERSKDGLVGTPRACANGKPVEAPVVPDNVRSQRVLRKLGFAITGQLMVANRMHDLWRLSKSSSSPKDIVRRFAALVESGDLTALDELLAPDFALHNPLLQHPLNREEVRRAIQEVNASFDDRRCAIEELVAEGNQVVARYTLSGKQRADYQGIRSTRQHFKVAAVSFYRVAGGKIAEEWELVDRKSLVEQLGRGA